MKTAKAVIAALSGATVFSLAIFVTLNSAVAQTCVAPPPGLIAWWPGDGNANDIAGSNHGTLQNGAAFATGKVGQAFSLDGVDDMVRVSSVANIEVQQLTIDAWVLAESTGFRTDGFGGIIATKDIGDTSVRPTSWSLTGPGTTGKFNAFVGFTDSSQLQLASTNSFTFNLFHHVAMTWDGSALRLYVNGQLEGTLNSGPKTIFYSGEPLTIGEHNQLPARRAFDGLIDEVQFYNRPLSLTEIQAIFNAGSAGKCKGAAYACAGFEPPFVVPILLKAKVNRAIPLQMQLSNNGTPITDANIGGAAPVVNVTYSAGGGPAVDVTDQLESVGQSSEGNAFTYDALAGQWIFHLGTKPFTAAGTYTVTVVAGDTTYTISPTCTGQFVRSE